MNWKKKTKEILTSVINLISVEDSHFGEIP